jgi:uncharacterized protein YndB with AHSA1/START domain
MTMQTMDHEVWIEADAHDVFDALTTKMGLDRWWGPVIQAEPIVGSVVEFDHGLGAPMLMEINDLVPDERVTWRCVSHFDDPDNPASEWEGQTLAFEVSTRGPVARLGGQYDVTVLRLRVEGWPDDAQWYGFCNAAWGETLSVKLRVAITAATSGDGSE